MIYEWKGKIRRSGMLILDLFFPRTCVGCGKNKTSLCHACLADISASHENLPTWIRARYSYKNPVIRTSIWHLKYKNNHDIARVYGRALYDMILEDISETALFENRAVYLVPIPLSRKRMNERGYNQAELLVRALLALDTDHAFQNGEKFLKRRDTENRQSHVKNKQARLKNIVDSFEVRGPLPEHAHFILIDDVVTTGATLREARKTLLTAGVKKISAYAVAH